LGTPEVVGAPTYRAHRAVIFAIAQLSCVTESAAQLNMKAVFLHVLGDALGSVVVIISALLIKFIEADWKYRIDPVLRFSLHHFSLSLFPLCALLTY